MKITRNAAIQMFRTLGTMALGHIEVTTLDATMDNYNAFRKVAEDFDKLREELYKRLYQGVDEKRKEDFFAIVEKYERENEAEKKAEYVKVMETYTDIYPIYEKHITVLASLVDKDVVVVEYMDVTIRGEPKMAVKFCFPDNEEPRFFLTRSETLRDKITRDRDYMPCVVTILERTNKAGRKYYTYE